MSGRQNDILALNRLSCRGLESANRAILDQQFGNAYAKADLSAGRLNGLTKIRDNRR